MGRSRRPGVFFALRPLAGLALVLLAPSGCTKEPAQAQFCRQAALSLLDLTSSGAAIQAGDGFFSRLNPDDVRLDIAEGDDGIVHHVSCRFAAPMVAGEPPSLRAVIVDDVGLAPIRLTMLAIALGLPPDIDTAATDAYPALVALPYLAQQIINGLVLGAILALVASGYSLVYALTGIMQLAYGQVLTLGAFMLILLTTLSTGAGLPAGLAALLPAAVAAIFCTALWGSAIQRAVYRPIERADDGDRPVDAHRLTPLIAGIGLGITLESLMRVTQGPGDLWLDRVLPGHLTLWDVDGFTVVIGDNQLVILSAAVAIGTCVSLVITHTRLGRLYRATADNPGMAALLGVDTRALTFWTVATGAGLAGLSGLAITLDYGEADAGMGFLFGFKALTAALIGGLGSLRGAVLGGFILGMAEALWVAYMDVAYRDAMVFVLLCLALVFRPEGLFGGNTVGPPDERRHHQF